MQGRRVADSEVAFIASLGTPPLRYQFVLRQDFSLLRGNTEIKKPIIFSVNSGYEAHLEYFEQEKILGFIRRHAESIPNSKEINVFKSKHGPADKRRSVRMLKANSHIIMTMTFPCTDAEIEGFKREDMELADVPA